MQDKLKDILEELRKLDTRLCEAIESSQVVAPSSIYEHIAEDLLSRSLKVTSDLTSIHLDTIASQHN